MLQQPLLGYTPGNSPRTRGVPNTEPEKGDKDIVQFTSPLYYVEEEEGQLTIDLMRMGTLEGEIKVQYKTVDASGKAGIRYQASRGTVVFKDGESDQSIVVKVIDTDNWATTLEFKVELAGPENCTLGLYLFRTRVKVIDNDKFPSSKYAEQLEEGEEGIESISPWMLFWEFLKLNFAAKEIKRRTIKYLIMGQVENLYLFLTLKINIYLVDVLFNLSPAERVETEDQLILDTRQNTAILIGALYIIPMFFLHFISVQMCKLDLSGMTQEFIQSNMFRKYLNFSEQSREEVPASTVQIAIVQDAGELTEGYMATCELVSVLGKLLILAYFVLLENPTALVAIVIMPTAMLIFISLRSKVLSEVNEEFAGKSADVVQFVQECCQHYRLIADYMLRPTMCDRFSQKCEQRIEIGLDLEKVQCNNEQFPKWLGAIFVGVYIAYAASSVLNGSLSVGTFLATIKVFQELAEKFEEGYSVLGKVNNAFAPLGKLTYLLNMKTDLKINKDINRCRREKTSQKRKAVMSQDMNQEQGFRTDMIEIQISELSFQYGEKMVLQNCNLSCAQGRMVAIVGAHGSGKNTFLRLLGHSIFPNKGDIFIPTHLRVVHVAQENLPLMRLSAWKNLTIARPDADVELVKQVLTGLKMETMLGVINTELGNRKESGEEHGHQQKGHLVHWQDALTLTTRAKIHLARALIMNPEVLVLQKPLIHYDTQTDLVVVEVMRTYVRNRGVGLPKASMRLRRPRTLFFTPDTKEQAEHADLIWKIDHDKKTIVTVQFSDLEKDDLGEVS